MFRHLGEQQIDDLAAVVTLTVPAGAQIARIQAQAQNVRLRVGADPAAAVGLLLVTTQPYVDWDVSPLTDCRLIQAVAGAKAFVEYLG